MTRWASASGQHTCRPCSYLWPLAAVCCPTQALAPGGQANHQLKPGQPCHLSAPGFLTKAPGLTRRHLKASLPSLASFLGPFPNDLFIFSASALYMNHSAATVSGNHSQMVTLPRRPRPASQMMVALLGPMPRAGPDRKTEQGFLVTVWVWRPCPVHLLPKGPGKLCSALKALS